MSNVSTLHVGGSEANRRTIAGLSTVEFENGNLQNSDAESSVLSQDNGGNIAENLADENERCAINLNLRNVSCAFSVRCSLDLERIARDGKNVEFIRENAKIIMRFKNPACTASIWSSGKIFMTGAKTEANAKTGARRCARTLQKLGYEVKFTNYRIVNAFATCKIPFGIKIAAFAQAFPRLASYEPELQTGVVYKPEGIQATLNIFSTGSVTVFAPAVDNIKAAVDYFYGQVIEFKQERQLDSLFAWRLKRRLSQEQRNDEEMMKSLKPTKKIRFEDHLINEVNVVGENDEDLGRMVEADSVNDEVESENPVEVEVGIGALGNLISGVEYLGGVPQNEPWNEASRPGASAVNIRAQVEDQHQIPSQPTPIISLGSPSPPLEPSGIINTRNGDTDTVNPHPWKWILTFAILFVITLSIYLLF